MIIRSFAILAWLLNLFDPPPLDSMGRTQKIVRALLVTMTLVVSCILTAMLAAVGVFVVQRGQDMLSNFPEFWRGLTIILASVCVNAICVVVLFQIRKADRKLMAAQS